MRKSNLRDPVDPVIIENIRGSIDQFKTFANQTAIAIQVAEDMRTRIINQIEEAQYAGLDKRTASLLEDKLSRPYSKLLYRM